jgi:hypothetical protein
VLLSHGKYDGALTSSEMGLERQPNSAELLVLFARACDGLGRPDDALEACERVLALEPQGPSALEARILQSSIFFDAGEVALAFATAELAWNLAPGNVYVHTLIGNLFAWNGQLSSALGHIEWNWPGELTSCLNRFGVASWEGDDIHDKRVLVVHQQGFGDMLQMARYLPALRSRAERVIVECLPQIAGVMRRMHGVDDVVPLGTIQSGEYDAYARLMTLPRILGLDSGAAVPYLVPDAKRVAHWEPIVNAAGGYRVGLAWSGNPAHVFDFKRSLPVERLAPLGDVPGVTYYSLMMQPNVGAGFDIVRVGEGFRDFDDAAAVIAQLDLVITVDSAYAHLAGSLGVPVWTMLPRRPDWRWSGNGDTTLWYPSMRLFREKTPGWPTVIDRVTAALRQLHQ